MQPTYLESAIETLRNQGIEVAPGLTPQQMEAAGAEHGFRFPPDLRAFLEHGLPLGERFPDWRSPSSDFILDRLTWPADSTHDIGPVALASPPASA